MQDYEINDKNLKNIASRKSFMELKDLILTPLFLFFAYAGLFLYWNRYLKKSSLGKYFFPAITLKFIGAIAIGLLYQFYYRGGDTYTYFTHGSQHIWDAFMDSPSKGLGLIFGEAGDYTIDGGQYSGKIWLFNDARSYNVVRLSGFIGLFTYHTYTINALIFTLISFGGIWALFKVLCDISPQKKKYFALGLLYMPTVVFWGSGLMKDSICFGALGWFIAGTYHIIFKQSFKVKYIFFLCLGFLISVAIKPYIIYSYLIALGVWVTLYYLNTLRSFALKALSIIGLILAGGIFLYFTLNTLENEILQITAEAEVKAGWIQHVSFKENGSVYTFSSRFDGSIGSFIRLAPEAFLTCWFRPFIWEANNPLLLLMAIESMYFLYIFLKLLANTGKFKLLTKKEKSAFWMGFTFAVVFGIIVGISTGNFGSLQRYKVPGMPLLFFAFSLIIYNKSTKKKVSVKNLTQ